MFQYKLLRCAMTYLKRCEDLSRLMLTYHCHARGITNIDGLASSLFIRVYHRFILSVNFCTFQVSIWTLQSAETEIYSVHGSFVAAESPTHREYWPFLSTERMSCVTQHEDFNSTPTGLDVNKYPRNSSARTLQFGMLDNKSLIIIRRFVV